MRYLAPSLLALALAVAALLGRQSAGAYDLLLNGGFEDGAAGWDSTGVLEPVGAPVHSGAAAGRFAAGFPPQSHEVYQLVDVSPGQTYQLSGWIVLDDPSVDQVYLRINWFDTNGGFVRKDDSTSNLTIDTPAYQFLTTLPVDAPPAARSARVGVRVLATSDFEVYLDDIVFDGPAVTPTPGPTPTASPTATPSQPPAVTPTPPAGPAPSPTATPALTAPPVASPTPAAVEPLVFTRLTNGSFEQARSDGTPYAWRKVGGEIAVTTDRSVDGSSALAFRSSTGSTKWAYQTIRVDPLAYYQASAYAMVASPAAEAFLRLSWYESEDGAGPAIASGDSTQTVTGPAFRSVSTGPVQAPPDARSVKVRLMFRPGTQAQTAAYFDAVAFSATEPSAGDPLPRAQTQLGGPASAANGSGATPNGVTATPTPGALGAAATPARLANVKPSPAVPQQASALTTGGTNYDWAIALSIATPLAAFGFMAVHELRRRRRGEGQDGR